MTAARAALLPDPGSYALLLHNPHGIDIQVGRWRDLRFAAGHYIYIGSAFGPGGLRARVGRHLRTDKSLRWHIDYLRQHADPVALWISHDRRRLEHRWAAALAASELAPVTGFGCSDCGCDSHLFYHPDRLRIMHTMGFLQAQHIRLD